MRKHCRSFTNQLIKLQAKKKQSNWWIKYIIFITSLIFCYYRTRSAEASPLSWLCSVQLWTSWLSFQLKKNYNFFQMDAFCGSVTAHLPISWLSCKQNNKNHSKWWMMPQRCCWQVFEDIHFMMLKVVNRP